MLAGDRRLNVAEFARDLLGLHHGGAALGERKLFAGRRGKPGQFGKGVAQVIGLRARLFEPRLLARALRLEAAHARIGGADFGGLGCQAAIGIDQLPMRARIDERAVVVLAVDFDEFAGDRAQSLCRHPLIIDESAAAAIRELHPAQNEAAARSRYLAPSPPRGQGDRSASSKLALTWPCAWPWRTKPPSPLAPSARENASSKIDLPAPVSPVKMVRPRPNSRSSLSIKTISRMESETSMGSRRSPRRHLQARPVLFTCLMET